MSRTYVYLLWLQSFLNSNRAVNIQRDTDWRHCNLQCLSHKSILYSWIPSQNYIKALNIQKHWSATYKRQHRESAAVEKTSKIWSWCEWRNVWRKTLCEKAVSYTDLRTEQVNVTNDINIKLFSSSHTFASKYIGRMKTNAAERLFFKVAMKRLTKNNFFLSLHHRNKILTLSPLHSWRQVNCILQNIV